LGRCRSCSTARQQKGALANRPRVGQELAAFGLTEPDAGSDAGATRTTAELRDGSWVVSGSKLFITNAGTDITWGVTITARNREDEISNIVVENGTPGYTVSAPMKKLGWRASDTRELLLRRLLGALRATSSAGAARVSGSSSRSSTAVASRLAAMGVGLAQGSYDLAYAYAREREQFGKPISSFQRSDSSSPTWRRRSRRAARSSTRPRG
jgi:alkylation response protein AidB-like acyl-CoA dehydrogenase